jgi:hypothetical protein
MRIPTVVKAGALAAVLLGAGVAYALPAGADVSRLSPPVAAVQIGTPSIIDTKGAQVSVPVTTVCSPGATYTDLYVEIVENTGGAIARGGGRAEVPCTGGFTTTDVTIFAYDKPFKRGIAVASADFTVCGSGGCNSSSDTRETRVIR